MSGPKVEIEVDVAGNAEARLKEIAVDLKNIAKSTKEAEDATAKYEREIKRAEGDLEKLKEKGTAAAAKMRDGMRDAAGAVLAVTAALGAATVAGAIQDERQQQALQALGPAYDAVTRATAGTVSATEAWHAQQTLLQSGLTVSGQQLATITRAAREYARATGTETTAAIEQLSQALVNGEAGGLRRFGISVQQNATRTETFEHALTQLQHTQSETSITERSLAEETESFGRAASESAASLATFVSRALDIPGALEAVSRSIRSTTRDLIEFDDFQEHRAEATNQREARSEALRAHAEALQRTRANLQARHVEGVDLGAAADISGLTTEQIQTVRGRLDVAARVLNSQGYSGPETAAIVAGATRDLQGLPAQIQAMRQANTPTPGVIDIRGDRPTNAPAAGGTSPDYTAAGAARIREIEQVAKARIAAEIELRTQIEETGRAEKNRAVERSQAADALIDSERRERAGVIELATERQSAENALATAEGRGSEVARERVAQLNDVRAALQAMIAETSARIAQAEDEHRSQQEINELIRERVGLTRSLSQTTSELAQIQRENTQYLRDFADAMGGVGLNAASAFTEAIWSAHDANQSLGASVQNALREQLKALSKEAVPNVLKNLALAASAAFTNPAAAPGFLAAAGLWGAVGVAAGLGAAAIPAAPQKPAATGGGAASARAASLPNETGGGGPLTLQINVSGAMFNEGVQESVVRALDSAHARGVTPRFARS